MLKTVDSYPQVTGEGTTPATATRPEDWALQAARVKARRVLSGQSRFTSDELQKIVATLLVETR